MEKKNPNSIFPNIPFSRQIISEIRTKIYQVPVHCGKLLRGCEIIFIFRSGHFLKIFSPPPGHRGGLGFGKTVPRKHPATLVFNIRK